MDRAARGGCGRGGEARHLAAAGGEGGEPTPSRRHARWLPSPPNWWPPAGYPPRRVATRRTAASAAECAPSAATPRTPTCST